MSTEVAGVVSHTVDSISKAPHLRPKLFTVLHSFKKYLVVPYFKTRRNLMGKGEECPLCDPGSELRKAGTWRSRARIIDEMGKEKKNSGVIKMNNPMFTTNTISKILL